jgi:hypothetical protein
MSRHSSVPCDSKRVFSCGGRVERWVMPGMTYSLMQQDAGEKPTIPVRRARLLVRAMPSLKPPSFSGVQHLSNTNNSHRLSHGNCLTSIILARRGT